MKIIQLTAENIKKLKCVDITPKGHVVEVTGKNGNGKSSVLDSIWWALGGEKNVQSVPIRTGAKNARIRLDLGDMVVERKFGKFERGEGTEGLIIRNKTGAAPGTKDKDLPKFDSPQELLDALIGRLSFDPLAFTRKKPREQYEELRAIAKIELDIDAMESANKADFQRRTDVNRDTKVAWAKVDTSLADVTPGSVDESAIIDQIQEAAEHNSAIERAKAQTERFKRDAADKRAEASRVSQRVRDFTTDREAKMEDLKRQIAAIAEEVKSKSEEWTVLERKLEADALDLESSIESDPVQPIDVTALRASMDAAKATNALVARHKFRDQLKASAESLEADGKKLTDRMAEREKQIKAAIENAEMPVDGLSLSASAVTFNGLPFEQASDAEQLRISCAIAMAGNPQLRVIRIKNASLLDEDGLAILKDLAKDRDYQVWAERVDSSGKIGIVMEDGEVVADHQEELELT